MPKRITELEILRAAAAFAVVIIHVTANPMVTLPVTSRSFFLYSLLNQWSRFSIPAFVLITGLVLTHTYGRVANFDLATFLRKRLQGIFVPYLAWTLFYLLWRARVEGFAALPGRLLPSLIQGTGMYQLYFIVLIFQFYLLFPLLRPLLRSRWLGWAVAAAVLFQFALMWDTFYGLFHFSSPAALAVLRWRDRLFPWWLGYFMLGTWLAVHIDALLAWTRRYAAGLLLAAGGILAVMMVEYMRLMQQPGMSVGFAATGFRPTAYLYALVATVGLLGLGGWLLGRKDRPAACLLEMGRHSFGIFLVHPFVLDLTMRFTAPLNLTPTLYLGLVSAVVLTLSYAAARLLAALPFGHWLVGRT